MSFEKEFPAVPKALVDILKRIPKAALGFSGGVDSSYLLYAAKTCGVDIRGYYAKSQFQPQFELDDAKKVAKQVGADIKVITIDALSNKAVKENPADRCYHCKRVIFSRILEEAKADGYALLMDGSNASDDAGDRPGMRALTELKVISPLREAGLTKDEIREYSRKAGLFTWNKPAYACLATRIPTGRVLDNEILYKVEQAENKLFEMGFTDFRARVLGNAAKLQLPKDQILKAAQQHSELVEALSPWFSDVLLDLKPR
ncbi:MAG: ATP-dependent sacrificial sulfur transferase LarE [Caldicoprobacterales bacterium]